MPSNAPTVYHSPAPSGVHQTEHSYEAVVRSTLLKLGANDPDADTAATNDFWRHCMAAGIPPETTAAVIYSTARHRHAGTSTLREAGEAPTREEWEVIARRSGPMEALFNAAGRKATAVEGNLVVFGDFYDDETARDFARKLTKAGYIVTYGPHKMPEAAEANLDKAEQRFLKAIKETRSPGGEARIADVWDVVNYPKEDLDRILIEMQRKGMVILYPIDLPSNVTKRDEAAAVHVAGGAPRMLVYIDRSWEGAVEEEGDPSAMEVAPVISESSHIPWVKVERDPKAHEAAMELAKRYGPIGSAAKVYEVVGPDFEKEDQEVFLVIPLNLRGELKSPPVEIARGQRSHVAVGVNDVMRAVLASGCEGYYVAHSHPTGRCTPSKADRALTAQIKAATLPFGREVKYLDHFVVGRRQIYSIEEGKAYKIK